MKTLVKTLLDDRKAVLLSLILPVLLGFACEVKVFNFVQMDDFCELYQFKVLSGAVSKPLEVTLVGAGDLRKPGAEQKLRSDYANLIQKLHKAHARMVLFDLYFLAPDKEHQDEDAQFAKAIMTASKDKSFHVLIGDSGGQGKMSTALETAAGPLQRGSLITGGQRIIFGTSYLRRFIVAEQRLDGATTRTRFSVVLNALLSEQGWDTDPLIADFHPFQRLLVVRGGSNELRFHCDISSDKNGGWQAMLPVQLVNYQQLHNQGFRTLESLAGDGLTSYNAKVVLVGDRPDADYHPVLPNLSAFGSEIAASILNDLRAGNYPRRFPIYWEMLVIAALYWLAALSRQLLPQWPVPINVKCIGGLPVPIGLLVSCFCYVFFAVLLYRAKYVYIDVLYPLAALACGYFSLGSKVWKQRHSGSKGTNDQSASLPMRTSHRLTGWLIIAMLIPMVAEASADRSAWDDNACPAESSRVGSLNKVLVGTREDYSKLKLLRGKIRVTARAGLSLCAGDVLSTASSGTAVVTMTDASGVGQEISISNDTTVVLVGPHSIGLELGRLFANVRGYFDAATTAITLGVRGTEFELDATPKRTSVAVIEGNVNANSHDGQKGGLAEWVRLHILGSPTKFPTVKSLEITSLQTVTFASDAERPTTTMLTQEQCVTTVRSSSEAFALSKPEFPSFSLTLFYLSSSQRIKAFQELRAAVLCENKSHSAKDFEALGDVYADWADGERALYYYAQAAEFDPLTGKSARFIAKLANAFRLKGDLETAEIKYKAAIELDRALTPAYSGLGDVFSDRALINLHPGTALESLNTTTKGVISPRSEDAVADLNQATLNFRKSLTNDSAWGRNPSVYRAVIYYRLGEISLLLAIAHGWEVPFDEQTLAYLKEAQLSFEKSTSEWPEYPFAQTGYPELLLTEARMYDDAWILKLNSEEPPKVYPNAEKFRSQAEDLLDEAESRLTAVLKAQNRFAYGHFLLGEILEEKEGSGIIDRYQKAIQLDPLFAEPYYRIAGVLEARYSVGSPAVLMPRACTSLVAYLQTERPAFRATDTYQSLISDGQLFGRVGGKENRAYIPCNFSAFKK